MRTFQGWESWNNTVDLRARSIGEVLLQAGGNDGRERATRLRPARSAAFLPQHSILFYKLLRAGGRVRRGAALQSRSSPKRPVLCLYPRRPLPLSDPSACREYVSQSHSFMAKSKNHTNHNQSYKAHRNGIKRPPRHRYPSSKGVYKKFLRNQKFARKGSLLALRRARRATRKNAMQEG